MYLTEKLSQPTLLNEYIKHVEERDKDRAFLGDKGPSSRILVGQGSGSNNNKITSKIMWQNIQEILLKYLNYYL